MQKFVDTHKQFKKQFSYQLKATRLIIMTQQVVYKFTDIKIQ